MHLCRLGLRVDTYLCAHLFSSHLLGDYCVTDPKVEDRTALNSTAESRLPASAVEDGGEVGCYAGSSWRGIIASPRLVGKSSLSGS